MFTLATTILADSWHHDGFGWWIVFPLLWLLLIGGALVLLVRSRGGWGPPGGGDRRETALELLDARYARGEIDLDEYRERRSVLTSG